MNQPAAPVDDETSSRHRLLLATAEVLGRSGQTKLSLSEVALQAGVSTPRESAAVESLPSSIAVMAILKPSPSSPSRHATGTTTLSRFTSDAGLRGNEKLDAALRFIVDYQQSYSGVRIVDIEPEVSIGALSRVIPPMRSQLEKMLPGPNSAVKAATAIRVAVSHYIVRSDDDDQFLAQLRHAVGLKP